MDTARGLFVTATDTGVGKTVLTAGLALAFEARGRRTGVMKPVQSGNLALDPLGDAMVLREWTGVRESADELNVYALETAVAPLVAARAEGRSLELEPVLRRAEELAARYELLLVEGAGGLLVPLGDDWTVADLAAALGFPLLIVARPGLGTVNHTVLTLRVARALGLDPVGVVLNGYRPDSDPSVEANPSLIESFGHVRVLGCVPWLAGELSRDRVRSTVLEHVDVDALLAALA